MNTQCCILSNFARHIGIGMVKTFSTITIILLKYIAITYLALYYSLTEKYQIKNDIYSINSILKVRLFRENIFLSVPGPT